MNRLKFLFLITLLACVPFVGARAQSTFIRTFSGEPAKPGSHVLAHPDGGFIATTDIYSRKTGGGFMVLRYDACDKLMWCKKYWNSLYPFLTTDFSITRDGHFLLCGFYNFNENYDGFLVKIDSEGDIVFSNTFHTGVNEYVYSTGEMSDGSYFVYGNRNDVMLAYINNFVLKFDPSGNVISGKSYFDIPIWGRTIATSDGGILARTGRVIYKLDNKGDLVWGRELSETGYYESQPLEVDGGYIYARYGNTTTISKPSYIFKIDYNGNLLWRSDGFRSTNGAGLNDVTGLVELENGDLLVPGNVTIDSLNNKDLYIIYTRLSSEGDLLGQWLQSPDRRESHRYHDLSIGKGGVVYIAGNIVLDQKLTITSLSTSGGLEGCELIPVSTPLAMEPLTLTPIGVQPQEVTGSTIPLSLTVNDLDPAGESYCYRQGAFTVNIGPDSILCPGEKLSIGSDREFSLYQWSTGAVTRYIEIDSAGSYVLEASDGCTTVSDTMELAYYPGADPGFSVSPLFNNTLTPVHFNSGAQSGFQWIFNDTVSYAGDFDYYFNKNGIYPVVYLFSDVNGCSFRDTVFVEVKYFSVYIPTAFTPNGNGLNEGFRPEGFGIADYRMDIYTRWGERIYSERNGAWDGTYRGRQMQTDAYVYEITFTDDLGEEVFRRGLVNLVR